MYFILAHTYIQSDSYTYDQSGTDGTLNSLNTAIGNQGGPDSGLAQQSTTNLQVLNQVLGLVFPQVQQQLSPLAGIGNLGAVFTGVDFFELARYV